MIDLIAHRSRKASRRNVMFHGNGASVLGQDPPDDLTDTQAVDLIARQLGSTPDWRDQENDMLTAFADIISRTGRPHPGQASNLRFYGYIDRDIETLCTICHEPVERDVRGWMVSTTTAGRHCDDNDLGPEHTLEPQAADPVAAAIWAADAQELQRQAVDAVRITVEAMLDQQDAEASAPVGQWRRAWENLEAKMPQGLRCPGCGQPAMGLVDPHHAVCGNLDCTVHDWDPQRPVGELHAGQTGEADDLG